MPTETLAGFLEKQEEAYANFRRLAEKTRQEGIRRDPYFGKYTGFFVNLSHSWAAADRAAAFSRGLAKLIPSTVYSERHVHTTLASSAALSEGFRVDSDSADHLRILEGLARAAREAVRCLKGKRIVINYDRYLHTDVVAIAAGIANEIFIELASRIVGNAQREGIELRPPWGAHITLARFTENVPAKDLADFFKFIESARVPGVSMPTRVNVGYNVWSWDTNNPHATHGGHFVPFTSILF